MEVVQIPVSKIKVRFRLRNPSDLKVDALMESIRTIGLLHPIHVDSDNYLISGYHRLISFQKLEIEKIPAIINHEDHRIRELIELDENFQINILNHLQYSSHLIRREELMQELGLLYVRGDNRHTKDPSKLTQEDLAKSCGLSTRAYQFRKQLSKIHPEVHDLLVDTEWANSLMDLVRLSSEPDDVQRRVCDHLITGKCSSWKSAYVEGKLATYKLKTQPRIDFNMKERFGTPRSLMKFNRSSDELHQIISRVNHDEDLRHLKTSTQFGTIPIRLHQMNPDQAAFSIDYYTRPNDLICDMMNGRGSTAITSLYLERRFIGWDINKASIDRTKEVIRSNFDVPEDRWEIHEGCGCEMKELDGQSEVIDAVFTSPPYFNNAESYTDSELDLCNMKMDKFMERIDLLFKNTSRVIKRSNFEEKIFKPIIFTLGTARDGKNGILSMSYEFQKVAKNHALVLWDEVHVELNNPHLQASLQRNYQHGYVMKSHETQLTWVKF